jgi:hypothetical protein
MKRSYRHIISTLIIFGSITIQLPAQEEVDRIWQQVDSISRYAGTVETSEGIKPWSFNTTIGTSFGYSPLFGSAMNVFAAPHTRYQANSRLSFSGGLLVTHTFPGWTDPSGEIPGIRNISNLSTFISASYYLTENLVLHGTGVRSIAHYPTDLNRHTPNYQDLSVGATYHFGNFSIGASFHRSNNSFYSSPFNFGNTFYHSPFDPGPGIYGSPFFW